MTAETSDNLIIDGKPAGRPKLNNYSSIVTSTLFILTEIYRHVKSFSNEGSVQNIYFLGGGMEIPSIRIFLGSDIILTETWRN